MVVNNRPNPTFIDLFAGCGGLSLGLMKADWQGIFAIEKDRYAFETLHYNLVKDRAEHSRLKQPRPKFHWPKDWLTPKAYAIEHLLSNHREDLGNLQGKIDLVAGGPPCQGFSFVGRRKANDPRNKLFKKYLEFVEIIKPKLILIENVKGIAVPHGNSERSNTEGSYADVIKNELEELEYAVDQEWVYSSDFGVPQWRPRHLTIGIRRDTGYQGADFFTGLDAQKEVFLKDKGLRSERCPQQKVRDAISDLCGCEREPHPRTDEFKGNFEQLKYRKPKKKTKYQVLMRDGFHGKPNSLRLANHRPETVDKFRFIREICTPGTSLSKGVLKELAEKHPTFERERDGKIMEYKWGKKIITVLDGNKPSHTVTTLPDDLLHYEEDRILTVRECARLQSFPDWFAFQGKYTTGGSRRTQECPRYTQVGNAVAPLLAEAIGCTLKDILSEINLAVEKDAA